MLHPGIARTLQDYADMVFTSYISSQLQSANRIDIVWDVYIRDSLKATTREKVSEEELLLPRFFHLNGRIFYV